MNNPKNDLITREDMAELLGTHHKEKQCQQLRKDGMRFTTTWDGWPQLTWEAYNRQLSAPPPPDQKRSSTPKLEAI